MSECPPGVHSIFDPCPGNCTEPVSAREELRSVGVSADVIDYALAQHARELAAKIQADMEEIRAADWGKSSRSKRPYLQGMERAKKAIEPQKEGQ